MEQVYLENQNELISCPPPESFICPACRGKLTYVSSVRVSGRLIDLSPFLSVTGCLYQCMSCERYFKLVEGKLEEVSFDELKDIVLSALAVREERAVSRETEVSRRKTLDPNLRSFTYDSPLHKAYSVNEILRACRATHVTEPSECTEIEIRGVFAWLKEHLP